MKIEDLTGRLFGRLTVLSYHGKDKQRASMWNCVCECGNVVIVRSNSLKGGNTKSCGCLQREAASKLSKTHGLSKNPLYKVWSHIQHRIFNPKCVEYKDYGGRGIKICERWSQDNPDGIVNFIEDMFSTYKEGLTINRVNPNGDYCKENCIWDTWGNQAHFKRKRKGCSSECIGVSFQESRGKFVATINHLWNKEFLGRFLREEDAARAYDNRSEELYGDRPNGTEREIIANNP